MRKRLGVAASVLALTAGTVVGAAGPASADTPGCVSKHEFGLAKKGWAMGRVHRLFDTKGTQSLIGFGYQSRDYKPCSDPRYGTVSVDYQKKAGVWRLDTKYAIW